MQRARDDTGEGGGGDSRDEYETNRDGRETRLTRGTGHDGQGGRDVNIGAAHEEVLAEELGKEFVRDGGAVWGEDLDLTA